MQQSEITNIITLPGIICSDQFDSDTKASLALANTALQSFTETDPTVPTWAKLSNKPTYTANEVGALPDTTTYAGSSTVGGAANMTVSIPFARVDSTSTSTIFTATVPGITELRNGVCVYLMNGVVTSASGFTLNINNLGAKPVYSTISAATRSTTVFNANYTMLFVYNENRVEGGCWDVFYGYSYSHAASVMIGANSGAVLPTLLKFYRYRLLFTSADGTHYVPANTNTSTSATSRKDVNQTPIDPFGAVFYYNSTPAIEAENKPSYSLTYQQSGFTLGYSFNTTGEALTLSVSTPVYIKCSPQSDGSAIIDSNTPYVQALPSTEDGCIYIYLGNAYSATAVLLSLFHPIYYYKNGGIKIWTGLESRISALESRIQQLESLLQTN